jgi:hypothetical protein
MKIYYFDNFANEIVEEKDEFAPPERYFLIYPNSCDIYTDTYRIASDAYIDFSYTKEESWAVDYNHWYNKLKAHLEYHGVSQAFSTMVLAKRGYPEKEFKEILKEYR